MLYFDSATLGQMEPRVQIKSVSLHLFLADYILDGKAGGILNGLRHGLETGIEMYEIVYMNQRHWLIYIEQKIAKEQAGKCQ